MIEFHDPRGDTDISVTPYTLGIDLMRENNVTVGFLANGFPDSVNFLQAVADALSARVRIAVRHWNKGNASIPVSATMLEEIRGSCGALVAAYGH
ncbi:MAG: hypothetical protein R3E84_18545 [Pseudomonadales bacterium]|nr:hypothetical protein [Pseudomonadales bacterium]